VKLRLVSLAAALSLSVTGAILVTQGQAVAQPAAVSAVSALATVDAHSTLPPFAGHTYLVSVDNGQVYRNTYSANGTALHSETVQGYGVGEIFDAPLQTARLTGGLYFVSWVEPGDVTVSHVIDFKAGTVQVYFTYATANGRVGELHSATLTCVG
jgi:hypothetical protein